MDKSKTTGVPCSRHKTHELRHASKNPTPLKSRDRSSTNRTPTHLPEITKSKNSLNKSVIERAPIEPKPRPMEYIDRSYMYMGDPVVMTEGNVNDARSNRRFQSNSPFNGFSDRSGIEGSAAKKAYAEVLKEQILATTTKKLIDKRNEMEFENKIVNENVFFNKFGKFWEKFTPTVATESFRGATPDQSNYRSQTPGIEGDNPFPPTSRTNAIIKYPREPNMNVNRKSNNIANKSFDLHGGRTQYPIQETDMVPRFENSEIYDVDGSLNDSHVGDEMPNNYLSKIMTKKLASMIRGQGRTFFGQERTNPIAEEVSSFMREVQQRKALERQAEERRVHKQNENAFSMLENQIEHLKASQDILQQTLRSVMRTKEKSPPKVETDEVYYPDSNDKEEEYDDQSVDETMGPKNSFIEVKDTRKKSYVARTPRVVEKDRKENQAKTPRSQNIYQSITTKRLIGPNYHKLQTDIVKVKDEIQNNQKRIDRQLSEFKDMFRRWASNLHVRPRPAPMLTYDQTPPKSPESTKSSDDFKLAYRSASTKKPRAIVASSVSNKVILKKPTIAPPPPVKVKIQEQEEEPERDKKEPLYLQKMYDEILRLRMENTYLKRSKTPVQKPRPVIKEVVQVKQEIKPFQKRRIRSKGVEFYEKGIKHLRTYELTELL